MTRDLWILAVVLAVAFVSMPVYALGGARRRPDPHAPSEKGSFVLGSFVRDWFYWFIRPAEVLSLGLGIGPLFFNLLGVLLGLVAGGLFATGHLVGGGWAVLLGGVADIMDGRVARAQGVASHRGAFLDSSLDRFAEFGAFLGLAYGFRSSALALLLVVTALGGSLLVSYTRARGESLGVLCKLGVMQRAERLLLLGFGGILDPIVAGAAGASAGALMVPTLGLIAAGTVATAIFRTVWIAARLPETDAETGE